MSTDTASTTRGIDWETTTKRLLMLGHLGGRIQFADGHRWLWWGDDDRDGWHLGFMLKKHGLEINSKHYGGVTGVLDTVDLAIQKMGGLKDWDHRYMSLMELWNAWYDEDDGEDVFALGYKYTCACEDRIYEVPLEPIGTVADGMRTLQPEPNELEETETGEAETDDGPTKGNKGE